MKRFYQMSDGGAIRVFGAALAITLTVSGCRRAAPEGAAAPASKKPMPLVVVERVARGAMPQILEMTGEVVPVESAQISATTEGPIGFLPWREGDRVKAGQQLVGIDRPLFHADVRASEAALELARARLDDLKAGTRREEIDKAVQDVRQAEQSAAFESADYERIMQLVKSGALSPEEGDKARVRMIAAEARLKSFRIQLAMLEAGETPTAIAVQAAAVNEAEANLAVMRARLAECQIQAPFSGTITRVYARQGDMAAMKTPLLALADLDTLVMRCAVPEAYASLLRTGMTARISLDALPGHLFESRLTRMFPELDERMRTRTVELDVSGVREVMPGMFGRAELTLALVPDALQVPVHAVKLLSDGSRRVFVFAEGRISVRPVQTGGEAAGKVQILSGLEAEERVVVKGLENLKEGTEVRLAGHSGADSSAGAPVPSGGQKKGADR